MVSFSDKDLIDLVSKNGLLIEPFSVEDMQPASIDLQLNSGIFYLTETYFNEIKESHMKRFASKRGYLEDGHVFELGKTYIVPGPKIKMPATAFGTVEQKSTAGRLGIFSETLLEGDSTLVRANHIPAGFEGRIWFRIETRAFPLIFRPGDKINQLRVRKVNTDFMTFDEIRGSYGGDVGMRDDKWNLVPLEHASDGNSTILRLDTRRLLIQKTDIVDPIEYGKKNSAEIEDYWDVAINEGPELIIPKGILYLLSSKEATDTGENVCWKMAIKTEELGIHAETHRAGFGDPGFRATVTSEFINHHKNIMLSENQFLSRLMWERVTTPVKTSYGGHYQKQASPQPPKQFRNFNKVWDMAANGEIKVKKLGR